MSTPAAYNDRPARPAGLGILIGAILVIVSAFLTWFTLTVADFGEQAVKGVGNEEGNALVMALGALVLAVILAILGLILAIRGAGRGLAIASLVVSLFLLFVSAYAAFAPEAAITQFEAEAFGENLGISETEARQVLEDAFESDQLSAKAGVGTYVATAGSLLALLASILGIARGRRRDDRVTVAADGLPPAPATPPPPAPPTQPAPPVDPAGPPTTGTPPAP